MDIGGILLPRCHSCRVFLYTLCMVVCTVASLFWILYQKSPHLLAVSAQSDIIRVTCTSLAVDKTSREQWIFRPYLATVVRLQ